MAAQRFAGTVLPEGVEEEIYVVDGRFTFEPVEQADPLLSDAVILPGLADVHAHLSIGSPAPDGSTPGDRAAASPRVHLNVGVLAIREPGSPDDGGRSLAGAEDLPTVMTAGRFLAPVGRYFPGIAREIATEDLTTSALEELRTSGSWVKVIGDPGSIR